MCQASSSLSSLVGALLDAATTSAATTWELENADKIETLNKSIAAGIEQSTLLQTNRVNELFQELIPAATLRLTPYISPWSTRVSASVTTRVKIDGSEFDVARHGHGVQRAVMIAMLQAVVPDENGGGEPASDEANQATRQSENGAPAIVIGIEEPEIYQHPIRARHFARVLAGWSSRSSSQVIIATHSPLFLTPEQFESIRRFTVQNGCSATRRASINKVAAEAQIDRAKVQSVAERHLPKEFAEGFFADAAVFVEGESDRAIVEVVAERLGRPLDAQGIAVLCLGGKEGLKTPRAILSSLGIPVYIVADADALKAARKHSQGSQQFTDAEKGHRISTEELLSWLPPSKAVVGSLPFAFGDPTVITTRWTLWQDDLEAELSAWPSFCTEVEAAGSRLSSKSATVFRSSARAAQLNDLPDNLKKLIESIVSFAANAADPQIHTPGAIFADLEKVDQDTPE
jgi:putative ATP-dependent endonuclease of the OLD family